MATAPVFEIDPDAFWRDPYPTLKKLRATTPIAFVPQLQATLLTRRDDIFECEKNVEVFSSFQPQGLMTTLMGENMMRKDGDAHTSERKQAFPSLSPRTVKAHWRERFIAYTEDILEQLAEQAEVDLVRDFAMPVSANALREITGLRSLSAAEMDAVSQGMIDGCANYAGDPAVEARCHAATAKIDAAIDHGLANPADGEDFSLLSVLTSAEQAMTSIRANIKLTISGGQNEPRDAIAGLAWAMLQHPEQMQLIANGEVSWAQAFEEFARWISPIGMSPRRIAKSFCYGGVDLEPETRVFLMFGSANRDESVFENPDQFDIRRNTTKAVAFGAGPHFCAGAAASRCLIGEVAMPMLFERFPHMSVSGPVEFGGWAFRGPLAVPVRTNG